MTLQELHPGMMIKHTESGLDFRVHRVDGDNVFVSHVLGDVSTKPVIVIKAEELNEFTQ